MLLAVDIGNSSVGLGVFSDDGKLVCQTRAEASAGKSADEYAVLFQSLLAFRGVDHRSVTECVLSSVFPPVTHAVSAAVERLTGRKPLEVGPGVKTGLNLRVDAQTQLGSDLVADAVAALAEFPAPLILVNMGTVTTLTAVNRNGALEGVIITAGVRTSMDSLATYASELPDISVTPPKRVIGKNTEDSMRSGILYGHAAMLDGMVERVTEELKESNVTVVATGGLASAVIPYCKTEMEYRPDLTLTGLCHIARKNKR